MAQTRAAFVHSGLPSRTRPLLLPEVPDAPEVLVAAAALVRVVFVLSTARIKN